MPALVTLSPASFHMESGVPYSPSHTSLEIEGEMREPGRIQPIGGRVDLLFLGTRPPTESISSVEHLVDLFLQSDLSAGMHADIKCFNLLATATYKVQTDLMEMLHIANCVKFVRTVNRPYLFYKLIQDTGVTHYWKSVARDGRACIEARPRFAHVRPNARGHFALRERFPDALFNFLVTD
ncbi:Mediator of RNA polymerase II transcription subunit 34 [Platanthera zijinensis]|uniref:Mediator of RNA polymerase II transcription subunit 34 n=1 Tax=Platanthera zijinensis TaxID=2320716 RepID=A0AAP0GGR5_9ASPA